MPAWLSEWNDETEVYLSAQHMQPESWHSGFAKRTGWQLGGSGAVAAFAGLIKHGTAVCHDSSAVVMRFMHKTLYNKSQ